MLTLDAARTHDLIQLREPITLTVDTSRLAASGFDLTVWNSATQYGLRVGLIWRSIASALAAVYVIYLYRSFRGKVTLGGDGYYGFGNSVTSQPPPTDFVPMRW